MLGPNCKGPSFKSLLGRALGRALAHELGHYFLAPAAHTPKGLMQAIRPTTDFFAVERQGFEVSAEQCGEVAPRLARIASRASGISGPL